MVYPPEHKRLRALRSYDIMDTPPEPAFDELVRAAARFLDVPIAMVSLLDETRQWFKAKHGIDHEESGLDVSFCRYVIKSGEMLVVPDATKDERFNDNPFVTGPAHLRAYAGAPLRTPGGEVLGTLCVLDTRGPRLFTQEELDLLGVLASSVMAHLDTRKSLKEAERARDNLEAMNMYKSDFLARTSHELRTPMAAIVGYTELMQEYIHDEIDVDELQLDVSAIMESSRHLVSLLDDLLDLAKIEAGELTLHPDTFPIDALFEDLTSHISPLIFMNDNELSMSPLPNMFITCDRRRLLQVLINLSTNANKFTHCGCISIAASTTSEHIVFKVRDTGKGMVSEQIEHLFRAFKQVSSKPTSGVGLGLAICQQLVGIMGGSIDVTSTPGEGSCFTVQLPHEPVE